MTQRRIGKRHPLAKLLMAHGFTQREARVALNATFDAIKAALKRHEDVEIPGFGTLRVIETVVYPYRRWWRGRPVEFYAKPFRVVFIPHEEAHDE